MKIKVPLIFITTSRLPSSNLSKFIKNLKKTLPKSKIINRGSKFLSILLNVCLINNGTDIIMVHEYRGSPDAMVISHLPQGPSAFFYIKNALYSFKNMNINFSSISPNLIINNLNSPIGKRLSGIFCSLFSFPNSNSKRIISLNGNGNSILFRHHFYEKKNGMKMDIKLHEIGPSFDMYPYRITLGLLGENNPEIEWNLTPFINTFKKRSFLKKIN